MSYNNAQKIRNKFAKQGLVPATHLQSSTKPVWQKYIICFSFAIKYPTQKQGQLQRSSRDFTGRLGAHTAAIKAPGCAISTGPVGTAHRRYVGCLLMIKYALALKKACT